MNISPEKLVVIGILALLVLGPNRLPDAARTLGKLLADVRRMSGSLQGELKGALSEPRQALDHAVSEFGISDLRTSVRDTITSVTATANAAVSPAPAPAPTPPQVAPATPAAATPAPVPDDPSFN